MIQKKALFIDRDGTLIVEPEDFVIDSLEKLSFLPGVFTYLGKIARVFDYELIMVTNQDGLGTPVFPESSFLPAHLKMLEALDGEGIHFSNIHIDPHFEEDNSDTRKPGTGMLKQYMQGDYDLANSIVIGDRLTDIQLASNLGAKGILVKQKNEHDLYLSDVLQEHCIGICRDWSEIYEAIARNYRSAVVSRTTEETKIEVFLALDGSGKSKIQSGIGFFDHMLAQIAKHASIDLDISVAGDLHVDEHHTIEDTALALGEAFKKALGNKVGLERYGFTLPMDDCLASVAIDFGGRPWLVWDATFKRERIGDMPTEMFYHFFKSFSDAAACNLNIKVEGQNEHHKIESIFKAFAKAIYMAKSVNFEKELLPSTKGVL